MDAIFNVDFFIKKYETIPNTWITMSNIIKATDAWEWVESDREAQALYDLVFPFGILLQVNDGTNEWIGLGPTPRTRVLKFLQLIKKSQTSDVK